MRRTLIASAALLGLAVATPAFAQGTTPKDYLQQALTAVQQHHRSTALMAVNNAENALLSSGAAEESRGARDVGRADPPVIRETARAREAIHQGHWKQAADYLKAAMSHPSTSE
jgi:hypothetical protein